MIASESAKTTKSAAELVVKTCLIICTVLGVIMIILRLIRGDSFFRAVSFSVPPILIMAVFYGMILSQRTSAKKAGGSESQHP